MAVQTQAVSSKAGGDRESLLRRALIGDALFCAVAGAAMIGGSSRISQFTGLTPNWVPAVIGVGVLFWGVEVGYLGRREALSPNTAKFVIGADIAWVVVSYGVLVSGGLDLTTAGKWTIGILAEIVALFAVVKYLGLRRMRS